MVSSERMASGSERKLGAEGAMQVSIQPAGAGPGGRVNRIRVNRIRDIQRPRGRRPAARTRCPMRCAQDPDRPAEQLQGTCG